VSAEPQPTSAAAVGAEEKPPEALPAAFRRMPVEASDLMKVLPHRHPFVFLPFNEMFKRLYFKCGSYTLAN